MFRHLTILFAFGSRAQQNDDDSAIKFHEPGEKMKKMGIKGAARMITSASASAVVGGCGSR